MKIAFTLCSNNYLAQANVLVDSIKEFNPEYTIYIGLVDRKSKDVNYNFFNDCIVLPIEEISIPDFDSVYKKYNIVELNTCVKATYFKFLFARHPDVKHIFYFDPDIMILNSLSQLESEFQFNEILLTPHIITPITFDNKRPAENDFLNYGLYNLGFLGLKNNSDTVGYFLNWWEERTLKHGFVDICNGFFVDQLFINFVPLFYNNVKVLKDHGYNVGPWNLHERSVIKNNENLFEMSDGTRLIFYHFSSYNYKKPDLLAFGYDRYDFLNMPNLKSLYKNYLELLLLNKIESLSILKCFYVDERARYINSLQKAKKVSLARKILNKIKEI